jgi:hypothetical protein
MLKNHSYFILLLALLGCQNITGPNTDISYQQTEKYGTDFTSEVSYPERESIAGYSSLTHFSLAKSHKALITKGDFTNLVFAVNKQRNPVFASFLNKEKFYVFGYKETAITLVSAVILPFINYDGSNKISGLEKYSEFNSLVKRLEYLSKKNKTFIHDELTLSLLSKIAAHLTKDFLVAKDTQSLSFEHETTNSNVFTLNSNTKLPFSINFQSSITKSISNSLYTGLPLNIENQSTKETNPAFKTRNGAYNLSIDSDSVALKKRFQKLSRDLILKSYTIFGLDTKNYENNNITEISILNTNLPQNPTKPEALNHVRSHFKKEMKLFTKHLLEQLSGSDLNSDNFNSFVYFVQTLIISLDDESPLYNDDSFYDELDTFSNYTESKTICIENSDIVPCFLSVKKATYSIGNSGCRAGEFRITFGTGFYAPFGLGKGSKIKIDWEFSPSGKTGFWLMPIKNGKKKVNGRTKTVGCFNFGSKNELTLFISLSDHEGRISNTSHIIIERPKTKSSDAPMGSNAAYFESLPVIE